MEQKQLDDCPSTQDFDDFDGGGGSQDSGGGGDSQDSGLSAFFASEVAAAAPPLARPPLRRTRSISALERAQAAVDVEAVEPPAQRRRRGRPSRWEGVDPRQDETTTYNPMGGGVINFD